MKLHNNYWEYPWKKLFSHFWKFPPTKSVFLHLLHGWIDWKMIVNSHNIDCNKKESLHCRWLCLSCAWQVSPGCACLFFNVSPSHHKLYLISHTNTYNHTHTSMCLHPIRHRWCSLAWWVWSAVHVCGCSVPESWSSLEGPDSVQKAARFAAPPSSTTHAETPFSCPCCAVCKLLG